MFEAIMLRSAPRGAALAALVALSTHVQAGEAWTPPPALAQRLADERAAVADLKGVPPAILKAQPELTALQPVLARYGETRLDGLPPIENKFFSGYRCTKNAQGEATWTDPTLKFSFVGEHVDCLPTRVGRLRTPSGHEWIGGVYHTGYADRVVPLPNDVGELRSPEGMRLFAKVRHTQGGRGALAWELLAVVWPDGRFGWPVDRADPLWTEFLVPARVLKYVDHLESLLNHNARRFAIHHPTGAIVDAVVTTKDGRYWDRDVALRIPELGLKVEGWTSVYGSSENDRTAQWKSGLLVTLSQPLRGLAPGTYFGVVALVDEDPRQVPIQEALKLVNRRLIPADAASLRASARTAQGCSNRVPDGQAPPGWLLWWCSKREVIYYAPDAAWSFHLTYSAEGAIEARMLAQWYGMGRSGRNRWIEAERFEWRPEGPVPVGDARYSATWGDPLPDRIGSTLPPDAAGRYWAKYAGPMRGSVPHGVGRCGALEDPAGEYSEPCEYRNGQRVDPAYQALVTAQQARLAQERAAQEQREAQAAVRRAAEAAEEEERERRRREKQRAMEEEYAEIDAQNAANMQRGWAEYAEKMKADSERFAQESAGYQKMYEDALAAQRTQRSAPSQSPPPGTRDAAQAAADEAEYRRKRAAQEQAYADARAAAEAQARQDAARARALAAGSVASSSASSSPSAGGTPIPSECLVEIERKQGTKCGNPRSLSVGVRYTCGGKADVRLCLSTPTGEDCGNRTLDEGGTHHYYVCESTGDVRVTGQTTD